MVSDQQGRYLFLHAEIGGSPLLILACYIPLPYRSDVVTEGLAYIAQSPTIPADLTVSHIDRVCIGRCMEIKKKNNRQSLYMPLH